MIAPNPEFIPQEIAIAHGLHPHALLRHDQHPPIPRLRREAMRAMLAAGIKAPEVAAHFALSLSSVRYATRTHTLDADLLFTSRTTNGAGEGSERLG